MLFRSCMSSCSGGEVGHVLLYVIVLGRGSRPCFVVCHRAREGKSAMFVVCHRAREGKSAMFVVCHRAREGKSMFCLQSNDCILFECGICRRYFNLVVSFMR